MLSFLDNKYEVMVGFMNRLFFAKRTWQPVGPALILYYFFSS
jgi:hypothetical protein